MRTGPYLSGYSPMYKDFCDAKTDFLFGNKYLGNKYLFLPPKKSLRYCTRLHGIPYENGAIGFIHLEVRVVCYRI